MFNPTHANKTIQDVKDAEITFRNLHDTGVMIYTIDNNTSKIEFPLSSITNTYRDFLANIVVEISLSPAEQNRFIYNPKLLSQILYGTTELWHAILELNNILTVIEFEPEYIKVYDPNKLKTMMTEILLLESQNI